MRLLLLLLFLSLSSPKHSRRKNRNRKHRRKIPKPRFQMTPELQASYAQQNQLITDILNSDLQLANDDPFAASSFTSCIQPVPECAEYEECRRVDRINCSRGQCTQSPVQYCENVCTYQCNDDEPITNTTYPMSSTAQPTISKPLISTTPYVKNINQTSTTIGTTIVIPDIIIPENITDLAINTTKPTWMPEVHQHNCEFLSNRGGYQCQNWQSPTLAKDIKAAKHHKSNALKRYLKTNKIMFDLPLDRDWTKIYQKHIPVMTRELLTQHLFSECMNYHFVMFNDKMPMPQRKLEAESIIMMVRIRDTCGMPLTATRKNLMLSALWFFARNCQKNRTIGLAQYLIRMCEDEAVVDQKIEEAYVARALSKILHQSSRAWAKNTNIFSSLTENANLPQSKLSKMNPVMKEALQSAMDQYKDNDLRMIILTLMRESRNMMLTR